jgi:hypothetical protein
MARKGKREAIMAKQLIAQLGPHQKLYRYDGTGIAVVEDTSTGSGHSAHPNISATGSVRGMKARGFWGKHDRCVRSGSWVYNVSRCLITDKYDRIAAEHCQCGGRHD